MIVIPGRPVGAQHESPLCKLLLLRKSYVIYRRRMYSYTGFIYLGNIFNELWPVPTYRKYCKRVSEVFPYLYLISNIADNWIGNLELFCFAIWLHEIFDIVRLCTNIYSTFYRNIEFYFAK